MQHDKCIEVWRGRLGRSFDDSLTLFERFYHEVLSEHPKFRGMTPHDLVEWQNQAHGREAYEIKTLAQGWIQRQPWRHATKQVNLSRLASFFLHNRTPWPPDLSFHFTSDIAPVDGQLTFDAFRRILHNSNKMYRAVFLMMAQGLMGGGELAYVNVTHASDVLEHLTRNTGFFKLALPGRKKNRNKKTYYTVLSTRSDWASTMRDYIKSVPNISDLQTCLFLNSHIKPLTARNIQGYFHAHAVETGVIKAFSPRCSECQGETVRFGHKKVGYKCQKCGCVDWASDSDPSRRASIRYGVNPHEIRDLMRSRWRASGADVTVAEFMMQHDIDRNRYDKMKYTVGYAFQEYRKALRWLNVVSEDPERVDRAAVDLELEESRRNVEKVLREVAVLREGRAEFEEYKRMVDFLVELQNKKMDRMRRKT